MHDFLRPTAKRANSPGLPEKGAALFGEKERQTTGAACFPKGTCAPNLSCRDAVRNQEVVGLDLRVEVRTGVSSLRIAAQKHRAGKQTAQRGALCTGARRQRHKSRRLDQIPRRDSFSAGDLFVAMEHECMTSCVPLPSALTPPGSPKRAQHFLGKRSGRQQGQRAFRKERARQTCLAATRFGTKRSWDWSEQSSFFYDCTAVFSAERERT